MSSRFFTCSIPGCERPNLRGTGGCDVCNRYLCVIHMSPSFHKCDNSDVGHFKLKEIDDAIWKSRTVAEVGRLCSAIHDMAVCKLASSLNGDRSCTIEHSTGIGNGGLMGCANYHARICFNDGSPSWLFRVPRVANFAVGLSSSLVEYLVLNEYATLKFLEKTNVPAPRAFSYGISGSGTDHDTGVSFILMEELQGTPWTGQGVSGNEATEEEKAKVWGGLADILAELENHPFPRAGSLGLQSSEIEVSAVASDRFLILDPTGPFDTSTAYYTAFTEQYLELIADRQLYTEYPVDAYLVYRFLKDNVTQLVSKSGDQPIESFYLKHVDDKGDHFLVDDQLDITGVIDWQMARIVPRPEAFGPSLVTADMNDLCNGKYSLSPNDLVLANVLRKKGSSDLAASMAGDEKVRRLFWGLALETEWEYAQPLANAILEGFGVTEGWSQWRKTALKNYEGDECLRRLLDNCSW